jgi:flagellar assembly protein FliH
MVGGKHMADAVYQRWEPATLEHSDVQRAQMPTAAALEAIHQEARQEGFDAGFVEGVEVGRRQGEAQVAEEVRRMQGLLDNLSEATGGLEQALSEELLALALEISKQILRQALKVRPELLLPVVRGVMESLPQNTPHPHLHLNPEDAELVRARLQTEIAHGGWKIIEDQRVLRGGCRIETQVSEIDATVENRWQRLAEALGQDSRWLDE